ncbi:DUF1990 domain-containing protein [Streptomyces lasalocidi]
MSSAPFTYEPVGATRDDLTYCPPGFHPLFVRTRLGEGTKLFERAAEAVLTWEMHRAMGVGIDAAADRAAPGVDVTVTLVSLLKAPAASSGRPRNPAAAGWAYGTLEDHPECGEEAFLVDRTGDGTVWLTVAAFSKPAKWYAKAGGPATRGLQHAYARRCGAVLKKLCAGLSEE